MSGQRDHRPDQATITVRPEHVFNRQGRDHVLEAQYRFQRDGTVYALYVSAPPPAGWCRCGCGSRTPLASRNEYRRGHRKGEPTPYLAGHGRGRTYPALLERDGGYASPCWFWQRSTTGSGYGQIVIRGITFLVHRFVYEAVRGPLDPRLELDHLCRNRACANPAHLEQVPQRVNAWRGAGSRLTPRQAAAIRAATGRGVDLARAYGVSQSTICDIRKGRRWKGA